MCWKWVIVRSQLGLVFGNTAWFNLNPWFVESFDSSLTSSPPLDPSVAEPSFSPDPEVSSVEAIVTLPASVVSSFGNSERNRCCWCWTSLAASCANTGNHWTWESNISENLCFRWWIIITLMSSIAMTDPARVPLDKVTKRVKFFASCNSFMKRDQHWVHFWIMKFK